MKQEVKKWLAARTANALWGYVKSSSETPCENCGNPLGRHVIISEWHFDFLSGWVKDMVDCGYIGDSKIAAWVSHIEEVEDPCNEEFMKDIST